MAKESNSREGHPASSLDRLAAASAELVRTGSSAVNHQAVADAYKDISGARFVAFNLYDDAGTHFTTVAVSGLLKYHEKITSLLGFDLRGRSWPHDSVRHAKIQSQLLTRFDNLGALSGQAIPPFIIARIEQLFSLGEVFLMRIMHGERMVGDFTFVMPAGVPFAEEKATAIFSRQVALLLAQWHAERRLLQGALPAHADEWRLMERTLEEERDKARQASQAKSEFLANMSHEIRTPMNAILGFSEALDSRLQDPESKKMVASILSGGKLLLSLLNDILDLSKIEAGKLELFIQPVSPAAIMEETRMLFSEKARKRGLQFIVETSEEMPQSLALDETRVKQIIFNLISNAIKFTHAGHVRLSARFVRYRESHQGDLRLEVEDTGIGIPEGLADHIFEDFNQLSPENTRKYEGTGLGLSICKRLVEKMQGQINVKSAPGKGSLFCVTIPGISISTEAGLSIHNPGRTGQLFHKSLVLVIDDVLADIEIIESLLISFGLETLHALGGRHALEVLQKRRPDLILLDTRMPEMNGYAFLQTIKDDASFRDIPVLAYSATIPGYGINPLARLFSGHIQKPVRRHVLIHELARHLPYNLDDAGGGTAKKASLQPLSGEEAPENCQEILKHIEETFLPQWRLVKDQLVIFRIEEFAHNLEAFAGTHRFDYLLQYARKLLHESNTLDIESIKESMSLFPYICKELETVCKKSS